MKFYWLILYAAILAGISVAISHADGLAWNLGSWGTIQVPTTATDLLPLSGYDFINKQVIVGVATPLMTLYKEVNLYAGGVGEFQTQAPNVQPLVGLGADVKKYIPLLNQISALQVIGFGRYVASTSSNNHLGAGLAAAYKFGS